MKTTKLTNLMSERSVDYEDHDIEIIMTIMIINDKPLGQSRRDDNENEMI